MTKEHIQAYKDLLKTPLGDREALQTALRRLVDVPGYQISLGSLPGNSYALGIVEQLKNDFVKLRSDSERESYLITSLLENSAAVYPELAPRLNLGGLRLTTLPYLRPPPYRTPYQYNNLDFTEAKLHHEALVNAIKGGADINFLGWRQVGPDPATPHIHYSSEEIKAYLLLQEVMKEALSLQAQLEHTPRGIQALFDQIIRPEQNIFQIMTALQAHFNSKRSWKLTLCYNSFFRGRAAEVEAFYQKWSRALSAQVAPVTETTALLGAASNTKGGGRIA